MDQRTCQGKKRNVNPLKKKFSQLLKKNSHSESEKLKNEMYLVKNELEKAYKVIDDLEFELESVDLLALQNQWLRDELNKLKAQEDGVIPRDEEEDPAFRKQRRSYRQQVSVGMLGPQLISPPQEQRFGIVLD